MGSFDTQGSAWHGLSVRETVMRRLYVRIAAGVIFGYASARRVVEPLQMALAFLVGFGAVHVPAAIILFIKQSRGSAKS